MLLHGYNACAGFVNLFYTFFKIKKREKLRSDTPKKKKD